MYSCRFLPIFEKINLESINMKLRKILLAIAGLALMLNASAQKSKKILRSQNPVPWWS